MGEGMADTTWDTQDVLDGLTSATKVGVRRGALAKPPPRALYRVRDVVLRRGATTAPKTMVRNGPERNSHSKPMWDNYRLSPHRFNLLYVKCRQAGPARPAESPVVLFRHQIHDSRHVSCSSAGSSVGFRPSVASGSPRAGASLGARARALVAPAEQSVARPRSSAVHRQRDR